MSKQKTGRKTALSAIGASVLAWAVQVLIAAQYVEGGIGIVVGVAFLYVAEKHRDIDIPASAEDIINIIEEASDQSKQRLGTALAETQDDDGDDGDVVATES